MKTFKAMLRRSGSSSQGVEITVPKTLAKYLGLELGQKYEFAILLKGDGK
jgi:hypothetical protein